MPWLRRLATGHPVRRPEFDPGSVQVGFVVDKVALRQVFPEYFGLSLSISFYWCSITRKMTTTTTTIIIIIISFLIHTHYSGFHDNCGHHYEIIIHRHVHSSGFHSNYVNGCALPAHIARLPR
jgi:hypothetical protein